MSKPEDVNASLLGIQTYLQTQTYEKGTAHNDKRNIRKRSKDFKVENGELYFVQKVLCDSNDNNQKEYQRLRKAILTDKEKIDIISRLHVHENGTHFGIDKTSKAVQVLYYWVGITEYVKRYIRECPECILTRIEQNNLQTPGKKRDKRSSKILDNSQIEIENYTAQNNTDDTEEETVPEDIDYLEHGPDIDANNIITVPVTTVSTHAKGSEKVHFIIKEEIVDYPPELPISYFWELVEFKMFGPFEHGDSKLYVCVGIDVFSRWTEVKVFERPSVNLLASFILQLICRYGKMKNLHLRKNGNGEMKSEDVIQIINNSLGTDIIYKTNRNEHMDSFWKCVSEELKQNIDKNPNDWMNCLEIFLYPLRFGCSEGAEYSPAYLAHSREPVLIDSSSDRKDASLELRFTTAQQNKSVEKLYNLFKDINNYSATRLKNQDLNINSQRLSKHTTNLVSDTVVVPIHVEPQIAPNMTEPEIQPAITEPENQPVITEPEDKAVMTEPEIKLEIEPLIRTKTQPEMGMSSDDLTLESQPPDEITPSDDTTRMRRLRSRKCDRILPESSTKKVEKIPTKNRGQTNKETIEGCSSDVPTPDENRRRSLRGVKQDWSSLCGKRKRSGADDEKKTEETPNKKKKKQAPAKVVEKKKEEVYESDDNEEDDAVYDEDKDEGAEDDNSDNNTSDDDDQSILTINSFDADEFYTAIKHYLQTKKHKSHSSSSLKSSVCKSLVNFTVENSSLYYQASKKNLRKRIVMDEKERIKLMTDAHIDDEGTHLCKRKVIDCISAMNNYWRGLTLDCEAFVRACPQCSKGRERKTPKPVVMMESKDITEEKDNWYPITYYLKNKAYPPGYSKVQKTSLRRKSQNYFFKDNVLFYRFCNKPDSEPRECLFSKDEKIKVIKEAHIEDSGNHCGLNRTQEKIKTKYYWVGQTNDIYKYISKCCLEPEKLPSQYMDKKAALDEREKRFKQYFNDERKNKPVADGTMVTDVNNKTPERNEIDSSVDCNTSDPLDTEVFTNPSSTSESANTDLPEITATSSTNPFQEETMNAIASLNSIQNEASSPEKNPSISTQTNSLESSGNSTEVSLKKPTRQKTGNVKRQKQGWLQCAVCKTIFSGKVSYKIHMMKHYGVKPYECDFCQKGFTTMKAKVLHRRKHTGEKPYLCNICGRGFERKSGLRYHLKAHERGGGVPVHCDLCSRSFQTASRLTIHKSCKHPPEQPVFKCIQCQKVFSFKRSLKRHIASAHMKERKFQCELCEKTFARNEYLVKHVANQHNSETVDSSHVKEEPVNETILEYIDANTLAQLTAQGHVTLEGNIQLINQGDIQELQINGNSHPTHVVISQDSVQYEVECLTSDQNLSIEDQQAIQLLVQASLQSQQPYTTTQQQ
ncbi:uncharacterized protein LOC126811785 isoform X2 [Patella vulgata]|uniref:uncharacterized protein LOC126811785 isoform X2 n=1 Tax=Patella vulgata TaxID=6465 RepID=UPI00217FEE57|nr:uncharacterized protein LOC126811785 isoform X2 [Patella vulgata]